MSCQNRCSRCKCRSQNKNPSPKLRALRQPLSHTEVNQLLGALGPDPQLKLIVLLMLDAGLRKGEISRLKWSAVDLATGIISVPGKQGTRAVQTEGLLRENLVRVRERQAQDMQFVLGSRTTASLRKVQESLKKVCGHGSLHRLRHTWACRLVAAGLSPLALMEIGGWSFTGFPKSLIRLNARQVAQEYRSAHEAARKEN